MATAPPKRRRWFQISTGTMLLLVTAIALLLGWELHFIRERAEWRKQHDHSWTAEFYSSLNDGKPAPWPFSWCEVEMPGQITPPTYIPLWRIWLGDVAVYKLVFEPALSDEECQRLCKLFPEAHSVHRMVRQGEFITFAGYPPGRPQGPTSGILLRGVNWEQ